MFFHLSNDENRKKNCYKLFPKNFFLISEKNGQIQLDRDKKICMYTNIHQSPTRRNIHFPHL